MCKADIFNEIIQIVSRETEIAPKVILSGSKEAEVVDARIDRTDNIPYMDYCRLLSVLYWNL